MLDLLSLFQDFVSSAEVDIRWRKIAEALVISAVVLIVDKCADTSFQVSLKEVVFEQNPVFQGLVPALNLALRLRMAGCSVKLLHFPVLQPVHQILGDVASSTNRKQFRLVIDLDAVAA